MREGPPGRGEYWNVPMGVGFLHVYRLCYWSLYDIIVGSGVFRTTGMTRFCHDTQSDHHCFLGGTQGFCMVDTSFLCYL